MKKLNLFFASLMFLLMPAMLFAQEVTPQTDAQWLEAVWSWLCATSVWSWLQWVFVVLGAAVVIGAFIDAAIDDTKDKGFMKYVFKIPVVGDVSRFIVVKAIMRFPGLNVILEPLMRWLATFAPSNNKDVNKL